MEVFAVLASVQSMGMTGIQGYPVTVEAYCVDGMPMFEIVGLPDAAVKESRERVRAAMSACHTPFPVARLTLNLAPADVRKEGPAYDLPIALAILASMGRLDAETMAGMAAVALRFEYNVGRSCSHFKTHSSSFDKNSSPIESNSIGSALPPSNTNNIIRQKFHLYTVSPNYVQNVALCP